jgi:hypothetical protein
MHFSCENTEGYYVPEQDNFYCTHCHMGMGMEYYRDHIQQERINRAAKTSQVKLDNLNKLLESKDSSDLTKIINLCFSLLTPERQNMVLAVLDNGNKLA